MWSLYKDGELLKPLVFSDGKSQTDVVKSVLESIEKGNKIIFILGVCGTGKSAIALNVARNLGKASIVVPGKDLQKQYKKDYESEKYLLKDCGSKLKINVMMGRNNYKCKFLEDCKRAIPQEMSEKNSRLNDIFSGMREKVKDTISNDISADNWNIPCKIEIKEKNWKKLREYIQQNKKANLKDILEIKDVKRAAVAGACPYWSPVLPEKYEIKKFEGKKTYQGLGDTKFVFHPGKPGCGFYEQFNYFVDSDVIIFNSLKYKLETLMNRKPATEVEIIDECDEFLDGFSNQKIINVDRLINSLPKIFEVDESSIGILNELREIIDQVKINPRINKAIDSQEIIPLKHTGIYDLLKIFINSREFLQGVDDESYLFDVEETAKLFENFMNESFVIFSKKDNNLLVNIVTTNLAKKFKEMVDKNKAVVLMSGTLHSEEVLKTIFGLEKFELIVAEEQQQGNIEIVKTGLEEDCKYSNFSSGKYSRKQYLEALDKCIEVSKKPTLIHVNSFKDLPSEQELRFGKFNNLISQEKIRQMQMEEETGELVNEFKRGGTENLMLGYTTKKSLIILCGVIVALIYSKPCPAFPFKTKPDFITNIPSRHFLGYSNSYNDLSKAKDQAIKDAIKQIFLKIGTEYYLDFEKSSLSVNNNVQVDIIERLSSNSGGLLQDIKIAKTYYEKSKRQFDYYVLVYYPDHRIKKARRTIEMENKKRMAQFSEQLQKGEAYQNKGHFKDALRHFHYAFSFTDNLYIGRKASKSLAQSHITETKELIRNRDKKLRELQIRKPILRASPLTVTDHCFAFEISESNGKAVEFSSYDVHISAKYKLAPLVSYYIMKVDSTNSSKRTFDFLAPITVKGNSTKVIMIPFNRWVSEKTESLSKWYMRSSLKHRIVLKGNCNPTTIQ